MANIKNLASGTLAEAVTASSTTLSVYVGDGSASTIKDVWPATPFYVTIMPTEPQAGVPNRLDSEIVNVTAVSNDQVGNTVLTVVRGQMGTTTKAFATGSVVTNAVYADDDTNYKVVHLDTIDAATIPYRESGTGLAMDIRKYFANNSTASGRAMVFDEILLKLDVSVTDTSVIHYLRFGLNSSGNNHPVVRNMLSCDEGVVSWSGDEQANAIIGMKVGSNSEVRIRPYGGTGRVPTLADSLTLVTITDNSSICFGVGARLNLNTLYRLAYTNNMMYLFQNDVNTTLFNGNIKVYGIKYPTN